MDAKKIKQEAKQNIKNNYFISLVVVLVCTMFLSGGINYSTKNILQVDVSNSENIELVNTYDRKTNNKILDELLEKTIQDKAYEEKISNQFTHGVLSILVNEFVATKSILFSILNSVNKFLGGNISVSVIILVANLLLFICKTIFFSVLEIGRNRYFLEQRRYLKTNIDRCVYPYKQKNNVHLIFLSFLKNVYLFFWSFTIVGYFIKYYEYSMIPYILAENPGIKRKEAFQLSKELMKGNKWDMFKLDLSLLGWKIIGLFTFRLLNIFFTDIYEETLHCEFYVKMREEKLKIVTHNSLLKDDKLYIQEKIEDGYPEEDIVTVNKNSHVNESYSLSTYILFFFTFSFFGWIWEVILHLINNGTFVNRGTMYGPWIQIYGVGGVAILFLLKKLKKSPVQMFVASFLLCGIIEYSGAWYLETFKQLKYWDYSGYFLNLHGRICLEGLIVFGLGGCGITYLVAPLLDHLYGNLNIRIKRILCVILIIFFSIDFVYCTFVKSNMGEGIASEVSIN